VPAFPFPKAWNSDWISQIKSSGIVYTAKEAYVVVVVVVVVGVRRHHQSRRWIYHSHFYYHRPQMMTVNFPRKAVLDFPTETNWGLYYQVHPALGSPSGELMTMQATRTWTASHSCSQIAPPLLLALTAIEEITWCQKLQSPSSAAAAEKKK
jgi:hypothetical protein